MMRGCFIDMGKNSISKKKNLLIIAIISCSIICGIYYYTQMIAYKARVHSDDAGVIYRMFCWFEYGYRPPIKEYFSPLLWLRALSYKIFGFSENTSYLRYFFEYLICFIPAMCLSIMKKKGKIAWGLLPIFVFMAGITGHSIELIPKFHAMPTFICLCSLGYLYYRLEYIGIWKKRDYFVLGLILLWGFTEADYTLCLVTAVLPVLLFGVICEIHEKRFQRWYPYLGIIACVGMVIIWRLTAGYESTAYGSYVYGNPESFVYYVNILIESGLKMFNIPMQGETVLQFNSLFWMIRLGMLVMALGTVTRNLYTFIKSGREKIGVIDAIISLCFYSVIMAYLFTIHPGDEICVRYVVLIYYLVPIALCREIMRTDFLDRQYWLLRGKYNVVSIFFIVLCFIYCIPVSFERKEMEQDFLAETIKADGRLHNGIGEFWSSQIVDVLTEREVKVVPWSYTTKKSSSSGTQSGDSYNFVVEDFYGKDGEERKEYIWDLLGEPIETIEVSNSDAEIYLYDYDVRVAPIHVNYNNNSADINYTEGVMATPDGYMLEPGAEMFIDSIWAYTGKARFLIQGGDLQNLDMEFSGGSDAESVSFDVEESTGSIYSMVIDAMGNHPDISLHIVNTGDGNAFIQDCIIKRLENAKSLTINRTEKKGSIHVAPGNYTATIMSDGIKNADIEFSLDGVPIDSRLDSNGNSRYVCNISTNYGGTLDVYWDGMDENTEIYIETPYLELQNYW